LVCPDVSADFSSSGPERAGALFSTVAPDD
jgi:hypothetical protein